MDNTKIIEEFRSHQGKVGGVFEHMSLLLMTTQGAKSGKEFVIPVVYTKEGDKYVIAASKGGAPTNPDWYYNLLNYPEVTIEVGSEKFQARATNITGEERERLYEQHATQYPMFHGYKAKTTREIPVFVIERI